MPFRMHNHMIYRVEKILKIKGYYIYIPCLHIISCLFYRQVNTALFPICISG